MTYPKRPLGEVVVLHDNLRVPLSGQQRAARPGPYAYYGAQGVIDWIDGYRFDGRYLLVPEDGENLRSRKLPIAHIAAGQFWVNNHAHVMQARVGAADLTFLKHAIEASDIGPWVTGAAQPKLSQENLRAIEISCPETDEQRRVADVLTAFDELVDNNRRRIEILEETARSLYREWFVHHRIPDQGSADLTPSCLGSIPHGWLRRPLGELLQLKYGKALKAADRVPGPVPVVGSSGIVGWHDRPMVAGPGIVIGRKGIVGSVIWMDRGFYPIDTTFFVTSDRPLAWLRYLLEDLTFRNSHAAVPGLNREDALRSEVLDPGPGLAMRFAQRVEPLLAAVSALSDVHVAVAAARDLLLPDLVTGRVDVHSLGLDDVFGWTDFAHAPSV